MSFASKVRSELSEYVGKARHCQIAELATYYTLFGQVVMRENGLIQISFVTENLTVIEKCIILFKKIFRKELVMGTNSMEQYVLSFEDENTVRSFCEALDISTNNLEISENLFEKACCKRAFLRGMFISCGTVSDPNHGYHLEMSMDGYELIDFSTALLDSFGIEAKSTERKKRYIVYIKGGSEIVDFLNVVGAHVSLMEFENVRILKDVRNEVNRKVNCETANLQKTVSASERVINDIIYIRENDGFSSLPESLRTIARLRIEQPDKSLKELGEMLDPPVGKSGVNHRLRRLSEIASQIRLNEKNE